MRQSGSELQRADPTWGCQCEVKFTLKESGSGYKLQGADPRRAARSTAMISAKQHARGSDAACRQKRRLNIPRPSHVAHPARTEEFLSVDASDQMENVPSSTATSLPCVPLCP
eukprot:365209-Chlamydomonas_euryale.AAC.14